ncbi:hypothetical protein, partial [Salinibacter ruber]|uniref:hypothetical protein n=1 Tax=Salinibacter ruber TaxID=146919 RepID=UPI002169CFA1
YRSASKTSVSEPDGITTTSGQSFKKLDAIALGRQSLGVTVMLCAVKGQWTTVCASGRSR